MNCLYCEKGEKLESFTLKICELKTTILYLFKEQSYRGRVVLVLKRHAEELFELTRQEQEDFIADLCLVTKAASNLFAADKINCGMYGDTVKHLHVHVVPKKEGKLDWNGIPQMNPNQVYLTDEEYEEMIRAYRDYIASKQD
ncbi:MULTISPECIES: HIT family protein [Anaerotruncus]|uniref:HIT family protein n=1 Tax=Anaerotruncus TaxID=244127 RepID=UPI000A86FB9C|nr:MULTISPECIES: HIT family protein [Anaerotruncus]